MYANKKYSDSKRTKNKHQDLYALKPIFSHELYQIDEKVKHDDILIKSRRQQRGPKSGRISQGGPNISNSNYLMLDSKDGQSKKKLSGNGSANPNRKSSG